MLNKAKGAASLRIAADTNSIADTTDPTSHSGASDVDIELVIIGAMEVVLDQVTLAYTTNTGGGSKWHTGEKDQCTATRRFLSKEGPAFLAIVQSVSSV